MTTKHVVVDGSNLATEGRTIPSLTQLREAVSAYEEENPGLDVIVVVDATFEHRVDASEREEVKQAELDGAIVSPPAGAIGRGDAFVLKIAQRTGAVVLSNDSFQEFHGEYPWLFDEGRLVGGKPVPGVGWIFTPRTPVRGPKSRAATKRSKGSAPAQPAKKLAVARPDGSPPKIGDVLTPLPPPPPKKVRAYELAKELGLESKELIALAKKAKVSLKSASSSIAPEDAEAIRASVVEAQRSKKVRAYELAKELGIDSKKLMALAAEVAITLKSASSSLAAEEADRLRSALATEHPAEESSSSGGRRRRRRGRGGRGGDDATTDDAPKASGKEAKKSEAASAKKPAKKAAKKLADGGGGRGRGTSASKEPAPVNEPLALLTFVATFDVGSKVDATVVSYTSHGAMVEVALDDEQRFRCYAPTVLLGKPAPAKARDVLAKGTSYRFKVASIDAARRTAELALVGKGGR